MRCLSVECTGRVVVKDARGHQEAHCNRCMVSVSLGELVRVIGIVQEAVLARRGK
jgi:hypothetical protein